METTRKILEELKERLLMNVFNIEHNRTQFSVVDWDDIKNEIDCLLEH